MKLLNKNIFAILTLTILMSMVSSCSSNSDSPTPSGSSAKAEWKSSSVGSDAVSAAIILTGEAGTGWSARITEGSSFSSFDFYNNVVATQGTLTSGQNVIYLYCKSNSAAASRQAVVEITFGESAPQILTLTQSGQSTGGTKPAFSQWPELPADKSNSNWEYATHFITLNGMKLRNYSLCFDKSKKAALWVAYPLHIVYDGSISRTDAWAFDPLIPESAQPDCIKRSYGGNYDRGHQLPSADRDASYEMNAQTFYMSNMTPQLDRLNQDMWAKLETKVRNSRCSDTLYVVTGAYFGPGATTTTDGAGNVVPIPTHYYKVLLRTKSGNSGKSIAQCSDSELISIGFWVEQRSYGNIEPPTTICTTVADIESKTGFTFFPGVSSTVKSQNVPSLWGIN